MDLLATPARRRLFFALLYLSEGAPIGFLWWALPALLRQAELPLWSITQLLSLLALPWAAKLLWAPLVDVLRTPRFGLRGWILSAQLLMLATLTPLLWLDLATGFRLLVPLLVIHALAAATQDVAIDALAIASASPMERGRLNGWMQAGMLTGRAAFGGGALLLAARLGRQGMVMALLLAVGAVLLVVALQSRPSPAPPPRAGSAVPSFRRLLRQALSRRVTWAGLAFAVLGGAGFEGVGAVAGPFLLDSGAREAQVGGFFALPSVACMLAGSLAGGWAADRLGPRRATGLFLVAVAALVLGMSGLAASGATHSVLLAAMAGVYLGIGLLTTASYALFMNITDPRLGATQFSAFMGATNLCEAWAALAAGRLAAGWGYPGAFALLALASLAALPLLAAITTRSLPSSLAR